MDHPVIERIQKTGYPTAEPTGTVDYYGDEIMVGDTYIIDVATDEIIHEDNLRRYLEENDFKFMEG